MTAAVSVRYVDSSAEIITPESFLSRLVAEASGRPVHIAQDRREEVDLQLTSVQVPTLRKASEDAGRVARRLARRLGYRRDSRWRSTNPEPSGRAKKHVWFTGENVRPPAGPWDGYLSYDVDPLGGRNAYLPLWWYSSGVLGKAESIFTSHMPTWQRMLEARDPGAARPKFACTFINNPEPMRLHAIHALSKVGQVDVFGSAVGRPVPDKAEVAKDYRFVLCFENDVYPGYVTEKPFEAWATGAIPLWRGSDSAGYINGAAIINAAEFPDLATFADAVSAVDSDSHAWSHMASQCILAKEPDLEPAKALLRNILDIP